MKYSIKKYKGIGLIEVLLTTLVVALGLLAVASLQGNLMGISGSNKTRAEAKALAETKLEQLRDAVVRQAGATPVAGEFNAIANGKDPEIAGTNEFFYRYWLVDNLPTTQAVGTVLNCVTATADDRTGPERKRICVKVAWGKTGDLVKPTAGAIAARNAANGSATVDDEQVTVQSILTFDSLSAAVKVSKPKGALGGDPSTNAGSSTEIHDKTNVPISGTPGSLISNQTWEGKEAGQYLKVNENGLGSSVVYKCTDESSPGVIPFIPFEHGLYTRRVDYANNDGFKESIELAKRNFGDNLWPGVSDSCTRKIRYNGGIMLPIKGTVYSKTSSNQAGALIDIDLFTFDASESGIYCAFTPGTSATKAPYVCYAGGNCVNGPLGTTFTAGISANGTIVTECPAANSGKPAGDTSFYGAGIYASVGPGGWRGEVGLLGIPTSNSANNNVCFAEEVAANPATLNTARNYYSRRGTGNTASNEGINKPYSCHDFLIIDDQPNGAAGVHSECAAQVGMLRLASKTIVRNPGTRDSAGGVFDGTPTFTGTTANTVDLNSGKGSCHIITGTVPSGTTAVGVATANGNFECTVNTANNTYECLGSSHVASAVVLAPGYSCTTSLTTTNNPTCNLTTATNTLSGTITYSAASPDDLIAITSGTVANPSYVDCAFTGGVAKSGYVCKTAAATTTFTARAAFIDGTGVDNRAICRLDVDTNVYTSSPVVIYANTGVNPVRNINLKGGASITCP